MMMFYIVSILVSIVVVVVLILEQVPHDVNMVLLL